MVKDWTGVKKDVERLYHVENKPLSEVMRLVKGLHGFHASWVHLAIAETRILSVNANKGNDPTEHNCRSGSF